MVNEPQPGKFAQISTDLLSRGYSVRFRASGGSMQPAICHGDVLTVVPVAPSNILPGSVAVYRRFDRLIAHRVVRIDADDFGAAVFVLRGDAATGCDAPVAASQMLGEVVKVERPTSADPQARGEVSAAACSCRSRAGQRDESDARHLKIDPSRLPRSTSFLIDPN